MQLRRQASALSLFREIQFSRQGSKTRLRFCKCPSSFLRHFSEFRVFKQSGLFDGRGRQRANDRQNSDVLAH